MPVDELRLILPVERARFDQELCAHHSLHHAALVGETLRYVAVAATGSPSGRSAASPATTATSPSTSRTRNSSAYAPCTLRRPPG